MRKAQQLSQIKEPQKFGIASVPRCAVCKAAMFLARRTPHPHHGSAYELQSFACAKCDTKIHRSADAGGCPHPIEEEADTR